jgi:WD40 repeat protein
VLRACYAARVHRSPAIALLVTVSLATVPTSLHARGGRVSHRQRALEPPPPPPEPEPTNVRLVPAQSIALPGRGLSIAWAPDGRRLAVGGHFREKASRLRYDTRVADVDTGVLEKSFACHWFWAVSQAWVQHPDYGELLVDGGGDHAVKVWDPAAPGSAKCNPGQFLAADGAVEQLGEIAGWIVSLAFSPDGRWLAGASRDRTIRIWQIHPGPTAWRVVALWLDGTAGNFLSVDWAPDGRALVTADRRGRVAVWDFDPERDRWDDPTIAAFARVDYEALPSWCGSHRELTTRTPRWSEAGHGVVWNARWSPDGTRIAAAGGDGTASIYDATSGEVLLRELLPRSGAFHGLSWHPDGRWLAVGGSDGRIYVYDTRDGVLHDTLEGHADVVTAVAWSPDGTRLASTAGGPLLLQRLVDVSEGPDQSVLLWRWR